jgi:hypothetical protein
LANGTVVVAPPCLNATVPISRPPDWFATVAVKIKSWLMDAGFTLETSEVVQETAGVVRRCFLESAVTVTQQYRYQACINTVCARALISRHHVELAVAVHICDYHRSTPSACARLVGYDRLKGSVTIA